MSFRGRLTLFFLLIVVLPMIALAVLVTQIATDSTNGKADARLAEGLDSALTLYRDEAVSARAAAKQAAHDPVVTRALSSDQASLAPAVARIGGQEAVRGVLLQRADGTSAARAGSTIVAPYRLNVNGPTGQLGSITVSSTTPSLYVASVRHLTG